MPRERRAHARVLRGKTGLPFRLRFPENILTALLYTQRMFAPDEVDGGQSLFVAVLDLRHRLKIDEHSCFIVGQKLYELRQGTNLSIDLEQKGKRQPTSDSRQAQNRTPSH